MGGAEVFVVRPTCGPTNGFGWRHESYLSLLLGLLAPLPLLPPLLPPPAVRIVPVRTPAAKKAKYMIAAGWETALGNNGGSAKLTEPRLFMPISTSSSNTIIRKTVLRSSFAFIVEFGATIGPG